MFPLFSPRLLPSFKAMSSSLPWVTCRFFPVGFFWGLDFAPLAGTRDARPSWDPLPTNVGLQEDVGRERAARLLSGWALHGLVAVLPLLLLQTLPGLAPAAHQRVHFVPKSFIPPKVSCTLRVVLIYPALDLCACSSSWLCLCICKHLRTEMQLFLALFISKSHCFYGVGLCEGAESFQPSAELPLLQAGGKLPALQSTGQTSHSPSAPAKAELKY